MNLKIQIICGVMYKDLRDILGVRRDFLVHLVGTVFDPANYPGVVFAVSNIQWLASPGGNESSGLWYVTNPNVAATAASDNGGCCPVVCIPQ